VEGSSGGKRTITVREAADQLGVHKNTIYNWIREGTLEAEMGLTKHGRTWLIDPNKLPTKATTTAEQQRGGRGLQLPEEALTYLAREIVREAGLMHQAQARQEDRVYDTLRDHWKMLYENDKHTSTVAGALLLGLGAFASLFFPDLRAPGLAYAAAFLLVDAIGVAIAGMSQASNVVYHLTGREIELAVHSPEPPPPSEEEQETEWEKEWGRSQNLHRQLSLISSISLTVGSGCLLLFVFFNLNL
jgi:excisionase family DNA binding protein